MQIKLTFLGAARTVTGSRYLLEANGARLLVDCGLCQERELQSRNWQPFPVPPNTIQAAFFTHAHLDHCGLFPKFYREGFRGRLYCTAATSEIARLILEDSARLQEESARFKQDRHRQEGRTVEHPEAPLYGVEDARACEGCFSPAKYGEPVRIADGIEATFYNVGHVLGASFIRIVIRRDGQETAIVFSGDIGRWNMPILQDPALPAQADYLLVESTYGDRLHPPEQDTAGPARRGGQPRARRRRQPGDPGVRPRARAGRPLPAQRTAPGGQDPAPDDLPRQPHGHQHLRGVRAPSRTVRQRNDQARRRAQLAVRPSRPEVHPHDAGIEGHQSHPRLVHHHGRRGHVHWRPDQASPRAQYHPAREHDPLRRIPGGRHARPPDRRRRQGSPDPRPDLSGPGARRAAGRLLRPRRPRRTAQVAGRPQDAAEEDLRRPRRIRSRPQLRRPRRQEPRLDRAGAELRGLVRAG